MRNLTQLAQPEVSASVHTDDASLALSCWIQLYLNSYCPCGLVAPDKH